MLLQERADQGDKLRQQKGSDGARGRIQRTGLERQEGTENTPKSGLSPLKHSGAGPSVWSQRPGEARSQPHRIRGTGSSRSPQVISWKRLKAT